MPTIRCGCQSRVLFQARTHAARSLGFSIERPQPWASPVFVVGDEKNRPLVDRGRVRNISVEMRELFWFSPVRRNAPQIHLSRGWPAAHKVDRASILRPDLIVVVQSGLVLQD